MMKLQDDVKFLYPQLGSDDYMSQGPLTVLNKNSSQFSLIEKQARDGELENSLLPNLPGQVVYKKGVINEKTRGHFMIEIIQPHGSKSLDVLVYNVEDIEENDFLTLNTIKGRMIIESYGYDVRRIADNVKVVPVERGIKIILNKNPRSRGKRNQSQLMTEHKSNMRSINEFAANNNIGG